jgi:hypothetical protein
MMQTGGARAWRRLHMDNIDYLELTPGQVKAFRDWRNMNAPALLEKMREVAQGRIEFAGLR